MPNILSLYLLVRVYKNLDGKLIYLNETNLTEKIAILSSDTLQQMSDKQTHWERNGLYLNHTPIGYTETVWLMFYSMEVDYPVEEIDPPYRPKDKLTGIVTYKHYYFTVQDKNNQQIYKSQQLFSRHIANISFTYVHQDLTSLVKETYLADLGDPDCLIKAEADALNEIYIYQNSEQQLLYCLSRNNSNFVFIKQDEIINAIIINNVTWDKQGIFLQQIPEGFKRIGAIYFCRKTRVVLPNTPVSFYCRIRDLENKLHAEYEAEGESTFLPIHNLAIKALKLTDTSSFYFPERLN